MSINLHFNPHIQSAIVLCTIKEREAFSVNVSKAFAPLDGSLKFSLTTSDPEWLHIKKTTGELYGIAPNVTHDKVFKITITASNHLGYVTQSFMLKVLCTDVVLSMPPTLTLALNLRKEKYGFSHIHPYTPSLLEYIYTFYQLPQYKKIFLESMKKQAREINIKVTKNLSFQTFYEIVMQLNPEIEKNLQARLVEDNILLQARLDAEELQNLFRQESEQMNVTPVPVWDCLVNANQYNWALWQVIDNIFRYAARGLSELQPTNTAQHSLTLQLKPREFL